MAWKGGSSGPAKRVRPKASPPDARLALTVSSVRRRPSASSSNCLARSSSVAPRRGRHALAEQEVGDAPRLRAYDGRERQALRRLVGEAAAGLVHEDGAQGDERRAQHELPRRGEEGRHQEAREPPRRRAGLTPEAEAVAGRACTALKRERGDRRAVLRDQDRKSVV